MQVPLVDLLAQYHTIKNDVMAAFEDVLEHMQLFLGPRCQEFERGLRCVLWKLPMA